MAPGHIYHSMLMLRLLLLLRAYALTLTKRTLRERLAELRLLRLLLLLLLRCRLAAGWGGSFSRASLAAWCCVDNRLCLRIVWCRRRRFYDNFLESFCKVGGESVAAGINVDGWVEGLDEESLSDAPFHPIMFGRENRDIFFTKMMVMLPCVLKHGRFVVWPDVA